jgi:hypothetical protein
VDRIAVTASTYKETEKILLARYGDRNRIIEAHLDFLEGLMELSCTFDLLHGRAL